MMKNRLKKGPINWSKHGSRGRTNRAVNAKLIPVIETLLSKIRDKRKRFFLHELLQNHQWGYRFTRRERVVVVALANGTERSLIPEIQRRRLDLAYKLLDVYDEVCELEWLLIRHGGLTTPKFGRLIHLAKKVEALPASEVEALPDFEETPSQSDIWQQFLDDDKKHDLMN